MSTLIIAEHTHQALKLSTLPVVTAASQLSNETTLLIAGYQCTFAAEEAARIRGVQKVLVADAPEYAHLLPEYLAPLIAQLAEKYSHVLAPATTFGKNLLPRAAALLDVAQLSDVIKIITPDTFVRPIYAGNALATVQSHDLIKLLTVRTTAYAPATQQAISAPVEKIVPTANSTAPRVTWISQQDSKSDHPELTSARIVISGGRGLGSAENFKLLEKIANKLGAALGASRAAVDAGFAPNDWQIGQTGKVVAPDLYIAVGISGAIQHIAGMKDSKVVVAINRDPDAPIFQVADYGWVGDLFQGLLELEALL